MKNPLHRYTHDRRMMRTIFKQAVREAQHMEDEPNPVEAVVSVVNDGNIELVELVAKQEGIPEHQLGILDNLAILVAENTAQSIAALLDTKGREAAFDACMTITFSCEYALTGTPYEETLMTRPTNFIEQASANLAARAATDTINEMEAFLKESPNT